jgi:ParB-like chromosome segregation protein Spo0J
MSAQRLFGKRGKTMSMALTSNYPSKSGSPPLEVAIDSLSHGDAVRSSGLDDSHVRLLMETAEQWPPIVIWGEDNVIVDGAHRVEAARRLNRHRISAVRFSGNREEAYLEAVRRNIDHGLPLRASDRRRAAVRVLDRHAEWSDRRIASLCGLSGKTVARLRRDRCSDGSPLAQVIGLERRVGRDGKARPVQSGELRDRIKRVLTENPSGSLRAIAAIAGASPETVRTVRSQLGRDDAGSAEQGLEAPVRIHKRSEGALAEETAPDLQYLPSIGFEPEPLRRAREWSSDAALLACGDGGEFARWFELREVGEEWHSFVWRVPVGHIYEVVDEARRRSSAWSAFASMLETRVR